MTMNGGVVSAWLMIGTTDAGVRAVAIEMSAPREVSSEIRWADRPDT